MAIDPRGAYDLALTEMVQALESYRDAQAAIDPAVTYTVIRGGYRPQQSEKVPKISVALSSIRPESGSAQARQLELSATYYLDLIANGRTSGTTRGDTAAYERLMYLIQQAMNAIYGSERRAAIESTGVQLDWPDVQIVEPGAFVEEQPLVGARITIEARTEYVPAEAVGTDIDSVSVDADRWSGLYEYGG